jgi:hypothetical protein
MKIALPPEIEAAPEGVRRHYERMIRDGQSESFALMCSLQQPPGTKGTDRALMEGRMDGSWLNSLPKRQADRMIREAKQAGISTSGRFYMSGLADARGHCDPSAWVDSTGDVMRVAEERNYEVNGAVNRKARDVAPAKAKDISDSILAENVAAERKKNPKAKHADLVEKVKNRIVPRWKRGK